MKRVSLFCVVAFAVSGVVRAQDDVYFIPSKEVRTVKPADSQASYDNGTVAGNRVSDKALDYREARDVDEYNRRVVLPDTSDSGSVREVESSFDDSEDGVSYPYTKMVMRFYCPRPGVIVSSPYYWTVCYDDVWDAYYDSWALSCPSYTWWSCAYDPWYYSRWHYRTCWDFTWGWHDPWWSYSYWGWGRPAYWAWSRPAFNPRHQGRPMWAHRDYGHDDFPFGHNGGRRNFIPRDFGHRDVGRTSGFAGGRRDNGNVFGRSDNGGSRIVRAPGRGDNSRGTDYSRASRTDNNRTYSPGSNRAYGRGDNQGYSRGSAVQPQRSGGASRGGSLPSFGSGSRQSGPSAGRSAGGGGRGGGGVIRGGRR